MLGDISDVLLSPGSHRKQKRQRRTRRAGSLSLLFLALISIASNPSRHGSLVIASEVVDSTNYTYDEGAIDQEEYSTDTVDGAATNETDGSGDEDGEQYDADNTDNGSATSEDNGNDVFNDQEQYNAYRASQNDDASNKMDDDVFHWDEEMSFDMVSVMPMACINYNNGHMIKFDLFESDSVYQCHFKKRIGSFVVSIAHYMRAYFNYQALLNGKDFQLPGDAGYLNCVMLQETASADQPLYAKIGCMDRETLTATKLQLHLYTDAQCSSLYSDGESSRQHSTKGYEINGYYFSSRVSFRPPFYSCMTCAPDSISGTFNKKNSNWYDDDYISQNGKKSNQNNGGDNQQDGDDYFDDAAAYLYANDDVTRNDDANKYNAGDDGTNDDAKNDDGSGNANVNDDGNANDGNTNDDGSNNASYNYNVNSNKYTFDDDYYLRRSVQEREFTDPIRELKAVPGQLEKYHEAFWREVDEIRRSLYDNYYDIGEWNTCQRLYMYGVWCDKECRSLVVFNRDEWSRSDTLLLAIMCLFMGAMMLLVVAKRLKATQKARLYGDDAYKPGLPPLAMAVIFVIIMSVILTLAKMKFVNETLVFAVVACLLLFFYMLKLTLFEDRRPIQLPTPQHDYFDNPLDDHLFD